MVLHGIVLVWCINLMCLYLKAVQLNLYIVFCIDLVWWASISLYLLVVHNEDDNLCQEQQQLCQVWDGVVSVIHSWEVHHIQPIHPLLQVVHEGNCGPLGLCSASWDLEYASTISITELFRGSASLCIDNFIYFILHVLITINMLYMFIAKVLAGIVKRVTC